MQRFLAGNKLFASATKNGERIMKNSRLITICFCVGTLSGCVMNDDNYRGYQSVVYETNHGYPDNYNMIINNGSRYGYNYESSETTKQVTVPDSYHVGAYHSPASAKNKDTSWVSDQNPGGYTIQIAEDEKPSQVAKKLYQLPKNDRTAEIQSQRGGKVYYKGLYGSYSTQEEAQKALSALPDEIKQGAGVRKWGSVQNNE